MKDDKHTGTMLVFVMVLLVLFLVFDKMSMLYAALGVGGIALFLPWLSRHIHNLWMKFAHLLGSVMNKVLLTVVFYVFLLPVALLSRLFRKSPMKKRNLATYYTERNFTYDARNLEELF